MEKKQQTILINIAILVFFIFLIFMVYLFRAILLPFVLAVIISYILYPAVRALQAKGVPLALALVIIYLYILLFLYALCFFLLPGFWQQIQDFIAGLPGLLASISAYFSSLGKWQALPDTIKEAADNLSLIIQNKLVLYLESKVDAIFSVLNYLLAFILAPVLTFYILRDRLKIKKIAVSLLPLAGREAILKTAADIDHLLRQFLYGYLAVSLIVGGLSFIFLALLKVKYAMLFGLAMAMGEFIPYFGPTLAALLAAGVTFIDHPWQSLYVVIALAIVQQIDGAVITPRIIGQRTGLHPLAVVFAVLAGGYSFGMAGLLLAVPFCAVIWLVFLSVYNFLVAFKEKE